MMPSVLVLFIALLKKQHLAASAAADAAIDAFLDVYPTAGNINGTGETQAAKFNYNLGLPAGEMLSFTAMQLWYLKKFIAMQITGFHIGDDLAFCIQEYPVRQIILVVMILYMKDIWVMFQLLMVICSITMRHLDLTVQKMAGNMM